MPYGLRTGSVRHPGRYARRVLRLLRAGADQPDVGRETYRLAGALTVLADGRLALLGAEGEVVDLGDALAALVGEEPDEMGDRHVGRVRLVLEVLDRHEGLGSAG